MHTVLKGRTAKSIMIQHFLATLTIYSTKARSVGVIRYPIPFQGGSLPENSTILFISQTVNQVSRTPRTV